MDIFPSSVNFCANCGRPLPRLSYGTCYRFHDDVVRDYASSRHITHGKNAGNNAAKMTSSLSSIHAADQRSVHTRFGILFPGCPLKRIASPIEFQFFFFPFVRLCCPVAETWN